MLDYVNLFSPIDYERMTRQYISTSSIYMTKEDASLEFIKIIYEKINEARDYLLEEKISKN